MVDPEKQGRIVDILLGVCLHTDSITQNPVRPAFFCPQGYFDSLCIHRLKVTGEDRGMIGEFVHFLHLPGRMPENGFWLTLMPASCEPQKGQQKKYVQI